MVCACAFGAWFAHGQGIPYRELFRLSANPFHVPWRWELQACVSVLLLCFVPHMYAVPCRSGTIAKKPTVCMCFSDPPFVGLRSGVYCDALACVAAVRFRDTMYAYACVV